MKKSTYLFAFALGASTITFAQNVGINTDGSDPDANTILHIKNHSGSSLDPAVVRIENEKAGNETGVQIENSGTASSKWDIIVPGSSTDLRIKGNGSDHVTIQNDGDVGIGTTTPSSGLDIQTSMGLKLNTINGATTLDQNHNVILSDGGPYTVTLPAAASNTDRVYYIKNIDAEGDDITIDGNSTETIDGSETYVLDAYKYAIRIISDGTNWHVIDEFNPSGGSSVGTIASLDCGSVTGPSWGPYWTPGQDVDELISVPYTGDVAGSHSGQTVASTGVTGLTATLSSGTFSASSGNLSYHIEGTLPPSATGTASFSLSIGGQSCVLTREVFACGGDVTFTYNGNPVTYKTVESTSTAKCWMQQSLGASDVANGYNDPNGYGDLFQWGRAADGHQRITWIDGSNGSGENGSTSSNANNPADALFIIEPNSPYDWRVDQDNNLWNGESAANNPCPSGWRVPTNIEWQAELDGLSITSTSSAFSSVLKIAGAGNRGYNNGNVTFEGADADFWTSSSAPNGEAYFVYIPNGHAVSINPYKRSAGFQIRCIKD